MHRLVPHHVAKLVKTGVDHDVTSGAALLIDAEGSTKLASRLEPHANEGAEAFAAVLEAVFEPIVEMITHSGGSVVEMAGDGVVAVFTGHPEDVVPRTHSAASEIIERLSHPEPTPTPAGPESLKVRAVVGAGDVETRIWITDHGSAFVVHGPAVEEARAGEELTPGGVVAVGPTAARYLTGSEVETKLGRGFTVHRGPGVSFDEPSPSPADTDPMGFYPEFLTIADLRGEFRNVVSVFLDIRQGGQKAIGDVLDGLRRHGGYLGQIVQVRVDAHRCFAIWGAPISHEHDVGNALRFVGEFAAEQGVDVRAGVTRSTLFAGYLGGPSQETYTAIGPGVNLAARMCDAAPWGDVWVDLQVTSRLADPWRVEPVGPREYRGFTDPIETARVVHVPAVRIADPHSSPLVGRVSEMRHLRNSMQQLWEGTSPGVVAVTGEAGIGKSRLIEAYRDGLASRGLEAVWLSAQADEVRVEPLATLRDTLAGYFGRPGRPQTEERLDRYLDEIFDADSIRKGVQVKLAVGELLELPGPKQAAEQLDPETRYDNLVHAVIDLVTALEKTAPVIISVADAHWMDRETVDVFRRLLADSDAERVAILVEARTLDFDLEPSHVVAVGPLGEEDIQALAATLTPEARNPQWVRMLTERSTGNPFFAEQLVRYLGTAAPEAPVPADMRRLLVARLDGLDYEVRRLIQVGSVLGRTVDLGVLDALVPETTPDLTDRAVGSGVWRHIDERTAEFSNTLLLDAAYGMLLGSDARDLHRRAADLMDRSDRYGAQRHGEIARHYEFAGDSQAAARHHIDAANYALERFASEQGEWHLDTALGLLGDSDPLRLAALHLRYSVYDLVGDRRAQQLTIEALEALPGLDDSEQLEIALRRVELATAVGDYDDAARHIDLAMPLAESEGDDEILGRFAFSRARVARHLGRNPEAAEAAQEARMYFSRAGDAVQAGAVDDFSGGMAWEAGEFGEAVRLHRSAARLFAENGDQLREIRALNNLGTAMFSLGDFSSAREIHSTGVDRSRQIGFRMGEGDHLDNMGGTAWAIGDYELATHLYGEALDLRREMDDAWGIAISLGNLGAEARSSGRPAEGLKYYEEALQIDREIGRRRGEAYDLHGIGLCHLALEQFDLAEAALTAAATIRLDLSEPHLANESRTACAVAMLRKGNTREATQLIEEVLQSEGDRFFAGAVETTATRLRSIEVVASTDPDHASTLIARTREDIERRAKRISDPDDRRSYIEETEARLRGEQP